MTKGFISKILIDGGMIYKTTSSVSKGYNICNLHNSDGKYIDMLSMENWQSIKEIVKCVKRINKKNLMVEYWKIKEDI